jgi:cell division protein FtsN
VAENAAAVAAKLQGLGLPGRVAKTRSGLNVVVAGPYSDAGALRDALSVARRGFPQAYLR